MRNTLVPIKFKDYRMFDFHRTFGTITEAPTEFNFDYLKRFPSQNAEQNPNGCTAYTVNDMASNEDCVYYDDEDFTYDNGRRIFGAMGKEEPISLQAACKATTVYGVKSLQETAEQALNHRRGPYFIVKGGFDGLVSAMHLKQGCVALGTKWYYTMNQEAPDYIPYESQYFTWHAYEAVGIKGGKLIVKSWDGGNYHYLKKEQVDRLLQEPGAIALIQKKAKPEDIETVKMNIMEVVISWLQILIGKTIKDNNVIIKDMNTDLLSRFCLAIEAREGWFKGSVSYRNRNPGNIKNRDGTFMVFSTYEIGFAHLVDYVKRAIEGRHKAYPKNPTIKQFFAIYAPSNDKNDPLSYAKEVADKVGLKITDTMDKLLT